MRKIPFIFVLLFLLLGSQRAFAYDGYGTADQPYLIKSASDWTQLYQDSRFNNKDYAGKYFRLVADISVIDDYYFDNVVGWDYDYPFRGVFDGDGHTLTFTSMAGEQGDGRVKAYLAPFRYVGDGAVIKNLRVQGIAQSYERYVAGLVARVSGKVVIRNCWVSTNVNTTGPRNYKDAYNGGIVAEALGSDSDLTLENCRFDGKMSEKNYVDYSGGLVGKADGKVTLKNCLFKPSQVDVTVDHCATLVRLESSGSLSLDKCYYFTPMGAQQGTDASNMSASDLVAAFGEQWEVVGNEAVPILFDVASFEGAGTSGSPYLIASIDNWNYLMYRVSLGDTFSEKHFQLTNNVKIHKMIGEYSGDGAGQQKPFSGILDGNGNTLTLDLEGSGSHIAPFACIQNATFKNLVLAGSVKTSGMRPAGITSFVMGDQNLIENCKTISGLTIRSSYAEDIDAGAFVGRVNANAKLTIRGCSLEGPITIQYNSGYEGGGFVGFAQAGAHVTVQDCVFGMVVLLSTKGKPESDVYSEQYYLFVGGSDAANVNITNCYYMPSFILNTLLKNGSVKAQGMRQYNIDGSDGVTVKLDGTETVYDVSGITAYSENYGIKTGINSWAWGAEDKDVKLLLSKGEQVASYTANHGTLTGTEYSGTNDHYTLNVSKATLDSDVTLVYISYNGLLYLQDSDSSADIITKEHGKTHTVVLGRTLKGGKWNSFCAPFAISEGKVTSVFGNGVTVKKLTSSTNDNGALQLGFTAVTSMEAGTPYLIQPTADVVNPRFDNVVIDKNTYPVQTTAAKFMPAINPTGFTARDKNILFFTGDGSMTFPADGSKMNGFRAYIQLIGE
jgi:hypothetical protein